MKNLIKILKLINKSYFENNHLEKNSTVGRNKVYNDFTILKIYLILKILNLNIKQIAELLEKNNELKNYVI